VSDGVNDTRDLNELSDMAFALAVELGLIREEEPGGVLTALQLLQAMAGLRLTLVKCMGAINEAEDALMARLYNLTDGS
jgi:hypothetical protein